VTSNLKTHVEIFSNGNFSLPEALLKIGAFLASGSQDISLFPKPLKPF
jgi:hypothetical protein